MDPSNQHDKQAPNVPKLQGEALAAARHRGSHVQIIAAAGSGKTEVVSQRVALLIAEPRTPVGPRRRCSWE